MFSLAIDGTDQVVAARKEESLLDACLTQGVPLPYNCRSGECGECLARLVRGKVRELPGADPAIFSDEMRRDGMILTCMCYPETDVVVSVPLRATSHPQIQHFDAVIERVKWFGERTAQVTMRCPTPISFRSGQYFEWFAPGTSSARSYSASNRPGSTQLEFLVRIYPGGRVSSLLQRHELAAGDIVSLRGPFGSYVFNPDDPGAAIFVAGGTGLAPVKSIVESALSSETSRKLILFYGTRNMQELGCAEELQQWAGQYPQLQFIPVLSDEPEKSDWPGRRGTVVDIMKNELGEQFGAQAYLCGPPPMVDLATAVLERSGLSRADIYCDKFVPAVSSEA
ncbi:2Fe-2S iron-sulfur cluster-binding protein [Hydrogenophaga sp.]|uniref:2Fe-2S iron-sulfur cluster-binding protein n=1 Tax=Hydrogenophaga sp. TaxID=1904254 RepID=UPI003AF99571